MNLKSIPPTIQSELLECNQARPVERIQIGLSEAMIWKCRTPTAVACLRAWPVLHPDRDRLTQIHRAMQQLSEAGLSFTPRLYCTSRQESFASDGQRFWELTSWLPGQADYLVQPSETKLLAAMRSLASIHQVWADSGQQAISPTLEDRKHRLRAGLGSVADVESRVRRMSGNERQGWLAQETCQALQRYGPSLIVELGQLDTRTALHRVLRDIWSDHVLFTGDAVTGIIDFGAVRIDEPTTDLVRLLSSLEPLDIAKQELGLVAYESCRDVSIDRKRFAILRQAATLLSAVQWMNWLIVECRRFEAPPEELLNRWQQFLSCAHYLAECK